MLSFFAPAGHHLMVVEYHENTVDAVACLSWAAVINITNWRGEYFKNKTLSGAPAMVRDDAQINFQWGTGSAVPGIIGRDGFSVRWTRSLNLAAWSYRFSMTVGDGGRLWVNGHLLIDVWKDQAPRTYRGGLYVPGGAVPDRWWQGFLHNQTVWLLKAALLYRRRCLGYQRAIVDVPYRLAQ